MEIVMQASWEMVGVNLYGGDPHAGQRGGGRGWAVVNEKFMTGSNRYQNRL